MATKVAHVTTIATSLQILLLHQLESLKGEGYQLYGVAAPDEGVADLEKAGVTFFPVPMTRRITPFRDIITIFKLKKIFKKEGFDIVHTHTPKATLLAQIAAKWAKIPIVINTLHGYYFHENTKPFARKILIGIERFASKYADVILSQNQEDVDTAIREGICSDKKIKYLGNGINITSFEPGLYDKFEIRKSLGIPEEALVVGFVGRLAAVRKGFRDFLQAGAIIKEQFPDVVFLVVGDADIGRPDAVHPDEAKEYGIYENCKFMGWCDNSELPKYHKAMDMLVLPSLFEGIPRVIMEAMAMGNPVVATNVRGNREAVFDNENGFLVPLGDYRALSERIIRLLLDQDLRLQMGAKGRLIAEDRFDERRVFDRVKNEYKAQLSALNQRA